MVTAKKKYVPERGDVVWVSFDPQAGHEQAGRRPALVLSPRRYNEIVGLAIMCPITSKPKAYPFEVHLPKNGKLQGAVLSDHVRSLDWVKRKATFIEALPARSLKEVLAKLQTLIGDQR